jgi:hypothetical protein
MDANEIKTIAEESCISAWNYAAAMQDIGEEISQMTIDVKRFQINGSFVILYLASKPAADADLNLAIDGKVQERDEVNFEQFDETSLSLTIFPSKNIMDILTARENPELKVIVDLKFLIRRAGDYHKEFGDLLGYPKTTPKFNDEDIYLPSGFEPSEEQRDTVRTVLNSKLSYVWGAPGTGKTQFVLATSILSYLKKGKKVCIIAPTNLSLEQVLRGVLKIIEKDDPYGKLVDLDHDVIRIGMATADFVRDYPNLCESKHIASLVLEKKASIKSLKDVIFEKNCELLKANFDEIDTLFSEEYDRAGIIARRRIMSQIRKYFEEIRAIISNKVQFAHLLDGVDEYNYRTKSAEISEFLYNRPRPAFAIEDYKDQNAYDLQNILDQLQNELADLESIHPTSYLREAKIVATTPQTFMGRFAPPGRYKGLAVAIQADHIFIDEACYCNVILALPFFMMGVPITMLGDHMQLPPVCQMDREDILIHGIKENNSMRYAFMQDQSALFAENYLFGNIKDLQNAYVELKDPEFKETECCTLTLSHRFGNNLAKVLDECIYHNGIKGAGKHSLDIVCVDTVCLEKADRENDAEADAIGEFLKRNPMDPKDFAILTPYNAQVRFLYNKYPKLKDNILSVHKSQGREWDTVIFSVADNRVANKEVPLRFTSTIPPSSGVKVVNTAVSRAKKRLVIVCDREFWSAMDDELIGGLVRDLDDKKILNY